MSPQPALEGHIAADDSTRLRREIAGLEQELAAAKAESLTAKQAAKDAIQAIAALRRQLEPMYNAFRMIFGEISRVGAESVAQTQASGAGNGIVRDPRWESLKARFPGQCADVIDLLLDHGAMTRPQIAAALHVHPDTVSKLTFKLRSFLEKAGGKFSLRED